MKHTRNILCPKCGSKKKAGITMMNELFKGKTFTVMAAVWKCPRCGHSHK